MTIFCSHSTWFNELHYYSIIVFRNIMVMMQSVVSGHTYTAIRERLGDKLETIRFDPFSKLL